jgi:hypothetical protein
MTISPAASLRHRRRIGRGSLTGGLAGIGLFALASCTGDAGPIESTPIRTPHAAETRTPSPAVSVYVDGTYTADGEYLSPSGRETIGVTITLVDDVVTDAIATPAATDPQARVFQKRFSMGISAQVVGRDLADLRVSRVSGSSLTSIGFNAAVAQIRAEALR